jgi:hypothetical protein
MLITGQPRYDVTRNEGLLLLAIGADTRELACYAIWRWWQRLGRQHYWYAPRQLIRCDCGGSNGYRLHRFKEERHYLAKDLRCDVDVAHCPHGCSKYNPIEHRLFCHLLRAWQSVVLRSIQVARDLARHVTTSTEPPSLSLNFPLGTGHYPVVSHFCEACAVGYSQRQS